MSETVDSSPAAIAAVRERLKNWPLARSHKSSYALLTDAAALLAQVARERDDFRRNGEMLCLAHDLMKDKAAAASRQLAEARAALRTSHCPRPWRGDDHTVGQCVERKHCGCDNDRALLSGDAIAVYEGKIEAAEEIAEAIRAAAPPKES